MANIFTTNFTFRKKIKKISKGILVFCLEKLRLANFFIDLELTELILVSQYIVLARYSAISSAMIEGDPECQLIRLPSSNPDVNPAMKDHPDNFKNLAGSTSSYHYLETVRGGNIGRHFFHRFCESGLML
jgi:hypothetical protein